MCSDRYLIALCWVRFFFFFFNDTATTEIYTLSLHDALPIFLGKGVDVNAKADSGWTALHWAAGNGHEARSEEHTSELQSQSNLVCRLLLEKKKTAASSRLRLPAPES